MNLEKLISEQQERNREKWYSTLMDDGEAYIMPPLAMDVMTTDTAHAVALAVIGEVKKGHTIYDVHDKPHVSLDYLTTLEAKIKDV